MANRILSLLFVLSVVLVVVFAQKKTTTPPPTTKVSTTSPPPTTAGRIPNCPVSIRQSCIDQADWIQTYCNGDNGFCFIEFEGVNYSITGAFADSVCNCDGIYCAPARSNYQTQCAINPNCNENPSCKAAPTDPPATTTQSPAPTTTVAQTTTTSAPTTTPPATTTTAPPLI